MNEKETNFSSNEKIILEDIPKLNYKGVGIVSLIFLIYIIIVSRSESVAITILIGVIVFLGLVLGLIIANISRKKSNFYATHFIPEIISILSYCMSNNCLRN